MYEMNNIFDKGLNVKLMNENIVEFIEIGVVYKDVELLNKRVKGRSRNMNKGWKFIKIYVNDGLGGLNIKYVESYRVYVFKGEKFLFKNSYFNVYF